jgi:hypothetical protein
MAGLVAYNIKAMNRPLHNYDWLVTGRSQLLDTFCMVLEWCQEMIYLISPMALLFFIMYMVSQDTSAFNLIYILLLLFWIPYFYSRKHKSSVYHDLSVQSGATSASPPFVKRSKRYFNCSWHVVFCLAAISILFLYVFQLRVFQKDQFISSFGRARAEIIDQTAHWAGLRRLSTNENATSWTMIQVNDDQNNVSTIILLDAEEPYNGGRFYFRTMWGLTWDPLLLLLLSILTRVSQVWEPQTTTRTTATMEQQPQRSQNHPLSSGGILSSSSIIIPTPTKVDPPFEQFQPETVFEAHENNLHQHRMDDITSNHDSKILPFWKQLHQCLVQFITCEGSVCVAILLFLISAFTHLNIISIVYMVLIRFVMHQGHHSASRLWTICSVILLFVVILTQFLIMLWLPPLLEMPRSSLPPWTLLSPAYQSFFALYYQHPSAILSDYCVYMCVCMILLPATSTSTKTNNTNRHSNNNSNIIQQMHVQDGFAEESPVIMIPMLNTTTALQTPPLLSQLENDKDDEASLWFSFRFFFMKYFAFALLLIVFISGCVHTGIVAGIYLSFSLYLLYYSNEIDKTDTTERHTFTSVDDVHGPIRRRRRRRYRHRNVHAHVLRYLRHFAWAYMCACLVFQVPFFTDKTDSCDVGTNNPDHGVCFSIWSILDLNKFPQPYMTNAQTQGMSQIPIFSIIIFFMVFLLEDFVLTSPSYAAIRAHTANQEKCSVERYARIQESVRVTNTYRSPCEWV